MAHHKKMIAARIESQAAAKRSHSAHQAATEATSTALDLKNKARARWYNALRAIRAAIDNDSAAHAEAARAYARLVQARADAVAARSAYDAKANNHESAKAIEADVARVETAAIAAYERAVASETAAYGENKALGMARSNAKRNYDDYVEQRKQAILRRDAAHAKAVLAHKAVQEHVAANADLALS